MDREDILKRLEEITRFHNVRANLAGSAVGSPVQALQERLRDLFSRVVPDFDFSRLIAMDVGDLTLPGNQSGYNICLSLPGAPDVWYLTVGASVVPFQGDDCQERAAKVLATLAAYFSGLDDIRPLKLKMRTPADSDIAPYIIREARFETWMLNRSTEFPSPGPRASVDEGVICAPDISLGNRYGGFLSFPVGSMGVMEVLTMFSESMFDMLANNIPFVPDSTIAIHPPDGWACVRDRALDGFLSPLTDLLNVCPGVHIIENGYQVVNCDSEYPAMPMDAYDSILPMYSLRYYLRRDSKWPMPGEFIGLLARPFPYHAWWYQETSPFVYAGNWIETNHYTSGVITEVLPPLEDTVTPVYKCLVRGVEQNIAASDFYGYEVGDRVAIIRIGDLDRFLDMTKGNYKWVEMEDLWARQAHDAETPTEAPYVVNTNMLIVPMSFYNFHQQEN